MLKAAWLMDTVGNEGARSRDLGDQGRRAERGAARARPRDPDPRRAPASPTTSRSPPCTRTARTLRIADGPDEVHQMVIARRELSRYIEGGA